MRSSINFHKEQRKIARGSKLPQSIKAPVKWSSAGVGTAVDTTQSLYRLAVRRMFWGRSSWYKLAVHFGIGGLTLVVLLGGISTRVASSRISAAAGDIAVLESVATQGDNLQAATALSTLATFSIKTHTVQPGDTLESLAQTYAINRNTIKWSNTRIISPYNDNLTVGSQLLIPDVDGVLFEVRNGDNFDKIISTTNGDRSTVIDVNGLNETDLALENGQLVFVPGGTMPAPPPLGRAKPAPGGYIAAPAIAVASIAPEFPVGFFDSPLTHPQCAGYRFNRGINLDTRSAGYHTGVDLAKGGGCPIRAVAPGVVKFAGILDSRAAWTVIIDHGNGLESHYYHGLPTSVWVKVGEKVEKGQDIMYMGNSGNSHGTHLHLTIKYHGQLVNPQTYIPM